MMKLKICFAASAALLLSGCHLFNGQSSNMPVASEADMSSYFAQRLAAGRAHLDSGRPTKAIVAFRQATYDPAFAAEAYNGMAVAYTRISRDDVARHLFAEATRRAPQDERYARNLAHLETKLEMLASAKADAPRANAIPTRQPAAPAMRHVTAQSAAQSGLVRVSSHEVRLVTASESNASAIAPSRSAIHISANNTRNYPVRVELVSPDKRRNISYPVRIALAPAS